MIVTISISTQQAFADDTGPKSHTKMSNNTQTL